MIQWLNMSQGGGAGRGVILPVIKHLEEVGTISFWEGRHTVPTREFSVAGFDNCINAMSLLRTGDP